MEAGKLLGLHILDHRKHLLGSTDGALPPLFVKPLEHPLRVGDVFNPVGDALRIGVFAPMASVVQCRGKVLRKEKETMVTEIAGELHRGIAHRTLRPVPWSAVLRQLGLEHIAHPPSLPRQIRHGRCHPSVRSLGQDHVPLLPGAYRFHPPILQKQRNRRPLCFAQLLVYFLVTQLMLRFLLADGVFTG